MNKEVKKVFTELKESVKASEDFGRDEMVALTSTAAIVEALNRIDEHLEELVVAIYKNA